MKARNFILIALLGMILCSCKERSLAPAEYVRWIQNLDNGLAVEKPLGDYKFALQYQPLEYNALMGMRGQELTHENFENALEEREGTQYFNLRIGNRSGTLEMLQTNLQGESEYFGRVEYFSFAAQQDFSLIDGMDTLPCIGYHFERTYGSAPWNSIVLAFDTSENPGDKTLVYNDQALGLGRVKVTIAEADIRQLPSINIDQL